MTPSSIHAPNGGEHIGAFASAQEAWQATLVRLHAAGVRQEGVTDPSSVGSSFGQKDRPTRELLAASFSIRHPRRRLFTSVARPVDIGYAIANVVWALSGSNDLAMIGAYNPNAHRFSDDGKTLFGAPGHRIVRSPVGDQLQLAAERLRQDPSSRRAIIQVHSALDLAAQTRDYTCLVDLQFFLRGGALVCIAHMRSQSALMVLPYDLFLLTMLHEALARSLGVEPGPYHHFCGSLHYYVDEEAVVTEVIGEDSSPPPGMPPMERYSPALRETLAAAEASVRPSLEADCAALPGAGSLDLDKYWWDLLRVMVAGALIRRDRTLLPNEVALIPPVYQRVLRARGPST
jgi:thymidylate synthase